MNVRADSVGATSRTDVGAGTTVHLGGIALLTTPGGPSWTDDHTGYHFYAALYLNF